MATFDRRLLQRAREARIALAVDALLGLVAALLVLAQAVLLAHVAARSFDGASLHEVLRPLALLCAVVCARATAAWGFEVVGRRAAGRILSRLRLDLVERKLRGEPTAGDGVESSELATLAVTGVDALETTFARYLPQVMLAVVVPVAVLALVASIDLVSAGIMLLTLPLVPVFMWLIGRYAEHRARERWDALAILAHHFADVVRGLPTLRAFNRSHAQAEQIELVSDRYRTATMGTLRLAFLSGAVLELAATIAVALVAVTVGVRLVDGGLGLQAGLTVLVLAPELYVPLRNVAAQFHASADGAAVVGRLLDLTAVRPAPASPNSRREAPDLRTATIRLEQVTFQYAGRATPALEDVDLELSQGETVGLVGPSGAGKSTIAALLLRLAEPTGGRVLVDGLEVSALDEEAQRRQLAWLPQRPTLLRGTVAENVLLADPGASFERVRAAVALADADGFVEALPDGYETVVGDGGRPLSAGQARRLALARTFLRDAPLVILDEPTAHLDPRSATRVTAAIDRYRGRCTMLLISHSSELVAHCDRIVRIEDGRVARALVEAVA
ncbi:MAG TPA: thiol reductant ABC exporter subunit CydD [Gaiellaceae bacterium]|nr:thiol reductant ABC exporter subunit CydD [Gaiellaceae bacterium]